MKKKIWHAKFTTYIISLTNGPMDLWICASTTNLPYAQDCG